MAPHKRENENGGDDARLRLYHSLQNNNDNVFQQNGLHNQS